MALNISNYEIANTGIILSNVYAKITGISYNAIDNNCLIHLEYYINKNASDENKQSIGQYTNSFNIQDPNGNIREQCYVYLKTLPEFQNTTDILEPEL